MELPALFPVALGGWIWGSIHYFPWWLSRIRKDDKPIRLDRNRFFHIVLGYGVFVVAVLLALSSVPS